uniref:Uncharacterized protein MANES_05G066000 n=1 Tax=Rhizophora mucronata TaxID=61149 RepID=A0A2P2MAI2_RHIMU
MSTKPKIEASYLQKLIHIRWKYFHPRRTPQERYQNIEMCLSCFIKSQRTEEEKQGEETA